MLKIEKIPGCPCFNSWATKPVNLVSLINVWLPIRKPLQFCRCVEMQSHGVGVSHSSNCAPVFFGGSLGFLTLSLEFSYLRILCAGHRYSKLGKMLNCGKFIIGWVVHCLFFGQATFSFYQKLVSPINFLVWEDQTTANFKHWLLWFGELRRLLEKLRFKDPTFQHSCQVSSSGRTKSITRFLFYMYAHQFDWNK